MEIDITHFERQQSLQEAPIRNYLPTFRAIFSEVVELPQSRVCHHSRAQPAWDLQGLKRQNDTVLPTNKSALSDSHKPWQPQDMLEHHRRSMRTCVG